MAPKNDYNWKDLFNSKRLIRNLKPSDSDYPVIRHLEAKIKEWFKPFLIDLDSKKNVSVEDFVNDILVKINETGSYLEQIYLFGYYTSIGLIENPIDFTIKDFRSLLNREGVPFIKADFRNLFQEAFNKTRKFIKDFSKKAEGLMDESSTIDFLSRNLSSVLNYASHSFFDFGIAEGIKNKRKSDSGQVLVYKIVYPGACKDCERIYLKSKGDPKIFVLEDLIANGDNIGRKRVNYLPVIGPLHLNCRCTLHVYEGRNIKREYRRGLESYNY